MDGQDERDSFFILNILFIPVQPLAVLSGRCGIHPCRSYGIPLYEVPKDKDCVIICYRVVIGGIGLLRPESLYSPGESMNSGVFSIPDYAALAVYLVLVVAIGLWVGRGQKDTKEYFLASRSMGWFAVGISTLASLYSAITYMGAPAEYFTYGLPMASQTLSIVLVVPVVMYVFMPFYHRLQVYTAYEYLEQRFDLSVRTLASGLFVVWRILWMATATYVPALVLHTVTGMPMLETILGVGIAATLYTVAGGMRAVIWTDVCQFFILVGGSVLAVWLIGRDAGGMVDAWRIAEQGGRTKLFDWSLDPTIRVTTWGAVMSSLVGHIGMYGADQVSVQRYLTAKSLPVMQKSFVLNMCAGLLMKGFIIAIGLGLFAFYATNPEQLPASIQGDRVFPYFTPPRCPWDCVA